MLFVCFTDIAVLVKCALQCFNIFKHVTLQVYKGLMMMMLVIIMIMILVGGDVLLGSVISVIKGLESWVADA